MCVENALEVFDRANDRLYEYMQKFFVTNLHTRQKAGTVTKTTMILVPGLPMIIKTDHDKTIDDDALFTLTIRSIESEGPKLAEVPHLSAEDASLYLQGQGARYTNFEIVSSYTDSNESFWNAPPGMRRADPYVDPNLPKFEKTISDYAEKALLKFVQDVGTVVGRVRRRRRRSAEPQYINQAFHAQVSDIISSYIAPDSAELDEMVDLAFALLLRLIEDTQTFIRDSLSTLKFVASRFKFTKRTSICQYRTLVHVDMPSLMGAFGFYQLFPDHHNIEPLQAWRSITQHRLRIYVEIERALQAGTFRAMFPCRGRSVSVLNPENDDKPSGSVEELVHAVKEERRMTRALMKLDGSKIEEGSLDDWHLSELIRKFRDHAWKNFKFTPFDSVVPGL